MRRRRISEPQGPRWPWAAIAWPPDSNSIDAAYAIVTAIAVPASTQANNPASGERSQLPRKNRLRWGRCRTSAALLPRSGWLRHQLSTTAAGAVHRITSFGSTLRGVVPVGENERPTGEECVLAALDDAPFGWCLGASFALPDAYRKRLGSAGERFVERQCQRAVSGLLLPNCARNADLRMRNAADWHGLLRLDGVGSASAECALWDCPRRGAQAPVAVSGVWAYAGLLLFGVRRTDGRGTAERGPARAPFNGRATRRSRAPS